MNDVNFIKIETSLPEYKPEYKGFFVIDKDNNLYIGLNGWKKIILEDINNK